MPNHGVSACVNSIQFAQSLIMMCLKKNNPAGSITKCYSFERGRHRDSESVSMLGFSVSVDCG